MAEWTAARDRQEQQYAQDRALWEQQLEDANRPLSKKTKVLIGLGYVGDKMLTGFIDYHASRAAIRSEMGRFDQRFDALSVRVGDDILSTGLGQ